MPLSLHLPTLTHIYPFPPPPRMLIVLISLLPSFIAYYFSVCIVIWRGILLDSSLHPALRFVFSILPPIHKLWCAVSIVFRAYCPRSILLSMINTSFLLVQNQVIDQSFAPRKKHIHRYTLMFSLIFYVVQNFRSKCSFFQIVSPCLQTFFPLLFGV